MKSPMIWAATITLICSFVLLKLVKSLGDYDNDERDVVIALVKSPIWWLR